MSGHVVPGISLSEEENFSLMLKDGFPLDNASSKCSRYTFWTNTKLTQGLGVFHMIQKGGSSGFLKGTYGLSKPFFFPFPHLIETFLFKDKCGL